MKFGKVAEEELADLDLTLPPDHPQTKQILANAKGDSFKVYTGCAKWGRKEWIELIYPRGTKDKNFLDEYVKNFNGIEMNTTFYSIKKSNVESWASRAPEGFKFSPKFNRSISHLKRINEDSQGYTDYFLECAHAFGDKLGPSFLQLPENFGGKYVERLNKYLDHIPDDFPLFVELRHAEWFDEAAVFDEAFQMMAEQKVGVVITDVAGRRDCVHQRLTIPQAFVRFNGYGINDSLYERLDDWVQRIKQWKEQGLEEVHFYAHQEDETHSPATVDYFVKQLNEACGLDIPRPNFIDKQAGLF